MTGNLCGKLENSSYHNLLALAILGEMVSKAPVDYKYLGSNCLRAE